MARARSRKRGGGTGPMPVGREIAGLLQRLGGRRQMADLSGLWSRWERQMGPELAAIAWPAGHRGGLLLLGCADSCAMQEARMLSRRYLRQANAWLGGDFFNDVRVGLNSPDVRAAGPRGANAGGKKKRGALPKKGDAPRGMASGKFLREMRGDSPVARCYARFSRQAGLPAATAGQAR